MNENINISENVNVDVIKESIEDVLKSMGKANIIIAGKTGVGKSTLINAVFQKNVAETGQGKPVTKSTKLKTKLGIPIGIYDTEGLELKNYKPMLDELLAFVDTKNRDEDHKEHIHLCWICIAESSRRVEDAEIELAKELSKRMPVIVVITKALADDGFSQKIRDFFSFSANIVRVNSVPCVLDCGINIPISGLEELVNSTVQVIPESQKRAFVAAQKISLDMKINQAHKIVTTAATAAGAAATTPVPFSGAAAIVPIQTAMLAKISIIFGLPMNKALLGTLVSTTFSSIASTMAEKAIIGALLKFFPGIGSITGGAITASVYFSLTKAFGETYILVLSRLLKDEPDKILDVQEIVNALKKQIKAGRYAS